MSTRAEHSSKRQSALLIAVLAVLFGILGMHALNNHGVMASAPAGADHVMSSAHAVAGAVEAAPALAIVPAEHAMTVALKLSAGPVAPLGGGHGPAGMLMLCLAMLVAVAITLAVVIRSFRPLTGRAPLPSVRRRRRPSLTVRQNGPPPTWEFSVIRC